MLNQNDIQAFAHKLRSLGIPCEHLQVFGALRLNVHVTCRSRNTADRWTQVLATIEPGRTITCTKTRIERKRFKADATQQSHIGGWLIAL
ncbi:hypothetical protein [Acidovorax sp. Root219]|uniref:hypothetical protein n=1 Tax=Acidovorax sp. Root219 TaxID=1736493 RepID=UPI00070EA1D3|nr:hypothetical protein [Acidovorax sp. Root219]KRC36263.1 hypothetical protein ASE28_01655 [Acidovorax sp. Root219]